tara:strand:- start:3801 stop:4190 length:390 start_codon:yes stop_codon:yes gene_type:complete
MSEKFIVEIITPDSSILKSDASEVVIPSYEGDMGILKDHIPLITFLRPGLIKIINETERKYFVEEGTVEFSNNNLLILTSTVQSLDSLKKDLTEEIIKNSENKMNNHEISDKEKYLLSYKIDTLREINK